MLWPCRERERERERQGGGRGEVGRKKTTFSLGVVS